MKALKFNIPQTWNDLSDWQLERIAFYLYTMEPSAKQDLKFLKILLNARWWKFLLLAKIRLLLWEVPLSEIKKHFIFIYKDNNRTNFIKLKGELRPPMDRIINIDAEEFGAADDLYNKWLGKKDPEFLYYLAAILYTPYPRPKFDKLQLDELTKPFRKIPFRKLLAIQLCYSGCKQNLVNRFPKAFPKGSSQTPKKYGFGKVILQMCKSDLSKLDKIKRINIYTFLEQFQQDIIDAREARTKKRK